MFWENWRVFKWTNDANCWFLFPRRWNLWYTESNIFSTITYFRLFESNWNAVNIMYLCWANVTIHIHHNATCTPWGWLHNENFWDMILPFAIDWHLKVLCSWSVIVTRLCLINLEEDVWSVPLLERGNSFCVVQKTMHGLSPTSRDCHHHPSDLCGKLFIFNTEMKWESNKLWACANRGVIIG